MEAVHKIFPYGSTTLDNLVSPEKVKDIRRRYNKQHNEVSNMLQEILPADSFKLSPSELSLAEASFDSDIDEIDDMIPVVEFSTPARILTVSKSLPSKDIIGTVFNTIFGSRSPSRNSGGGIPATRSTDCSSTVSSLNFSDLPPKGKEQEGTRHRRVWATHGKQSVDSSSIRYCTSSPETIPSHELFLPDDEDDEDDDGINAYFTGAACGDDEKDLAGDDDINNNDNEHDNDNGNDFFVINDSDNDEEETAPPKESGLAMELLLSPASNDNHHHSNSNHPTIMLEKSPSMQSQNDFAADSILGCQHERMLKPFPIRQARDNNSSRANNRVLRDSPLTEEATEQKLSLPSSSSVLPEKTSDETVSYRDSVALAKLSPPSTSSLVAPARAVVSSATPALEMGREIATASNINILRNFCNYNDSNRHSHLPLVSARTTALMDDTKDQLFTDDTKNPSKEIMGNGPHSPHLCLVVNANSPFQKIV